MNSNIESFSYDTYWKSLSIFKEIIRQCRLKYIYPVKIYTSPNKGFIRHEVFGFNYEHLPKELYKSFRKIRKDYDSKKNTVQWEALSK